MKIGNYFIMRYLQKTGHFFTVSPVSFDSCNQFIYSVLQKNTVSFVSLSRETVHSRLTVRRFAFAMVNGLLY